jgi:molecular chaperone DnaK
VSDADRTDLTKVNDELKDVLKDDAADAEKLTAATDAAMNVFQRVGQAMYQNAQSEASAPQPDAGDADGGQTPPEGDDDVVEGEIIEEGGAS